MSLEEAQNAELIEGQTPNTEQEQPNQSTDDGADDDDAAFLSGFAETRGEAPPTEMRPLEKEGEPEKAEAKTEQTPEKNEQAVTQPDPQAELKDKLRQEILAEITPHFRALNGQLGRITGDLQNQLAAAKKSAAATGAPVPTDKQAATAAVTPEKWKAFQKEFPEWTEAFEEYTAAQIAAVRPQEKQQAVNVDEIRQQLTDQFKGEIAESKQASKDARAYARIDIAVGDGWEQKVRTSEFGEWFKKLPDDKRTQYDTENATDIIAAIKEFDTHQASVAKQQRKQQRMSAAVEVQGTSRGGPSVLTDEDAFDAGVKETLGDRMRQYNASR
jgi:hypothetical protein